MWRNRNLHIFVALAHVATVVAIAYLESNRSLLINDGQIPLVCLNVTIVPELRMLSPVTITDDCPQYNILTACLCLHIATALFHAVYAYRGIAGTLRWVEYFFSAALVFVHFAITSGIREVNTLVLIAVVTATVMPAGAVSELVIVVDFGGTITNHDRHSQSSFRGDGDTANYTDKDDDDDDDEDGRVFADVTPFAVGQTAQIMPLPPRSQSMATQARVYRNMVRRRLLAWSQLPGWVAILAVMIVVVAKFVQLSEYAPSGVIGIVVLQCILLPSFGVVSALRSLNKIHGLRADAAYAVLSMTSKIIPTAIFLSAIAAT